MAKRKNNRGACPPVAKFWLQLKHDGTERRLKRKPPPPHLEVEVLDLGHGRRVEQTRTWSVLEELDGIPYFIAVPPKSAGWKLHEGEVQDPTTGRLFTVWRRPHLEGGGSRLDMKKESVR